MKEIRINPQGQEVINILQQPNHFEGRVSRDVTLTDEEGVKNHWKEFVTFPERLCAVFPGSKIPPEEFLAGLGVSPNQIDSSAANLLSEKNGTLADPTFHFQDGDFSLYILNGAGNPHALTMTRLAAKGFEDPKNRALYQQHLYESVSRTLGNNLSQEIGAGFVFRDDCIASVISFAAAIQKQLDTPQEDYIKKGVLVQIDGPITSQGVLLAKAYKDRFGFPLTLVGSHWAGGLTKGIVDQRGVRKHANYITYLDELLNRFDSHTQKLLEECRDEKTGIIQVVGDMGTAEEGIEATTIDELRRKFGSDFCFWNDLRTDSHGKHPNKDRGIKHIMSRNKGPIRYYPARGAYMSLVLDLSANPNLPNEASIHVERASRLWTKELGYGAGFKEI